ncbi:MAG: alpha/beta hydrolase family esterase [Planctomycetia bacterium]
MFVVPALRLVPLVAWLTPVIALTAAEPLPAGNHTRELEVENRTRSYLVHVPKRLPEGPVPVVLALHGAGMNGPLMAWFSGLHAKADEAGFVAVYPNGTGSGTFLVWNAGGFWNAEGRPDDVAFLGAVLDDLEAVLPVDPRRVYACGLSNGGMMCYRLAAELSDRIAAVAPVAGALMVRDPAPRRAVPLIHVHGTRDTLVPYGDGGRLIGGAPSARRWAKLAGCGDDAQEADVAADDADLPVTLERWTSGRDGAEVVLVTVAGGGHTWPGQPPPVWFIGRSTKKFSANDLIWEFFVRHPLP